MGEKILDIKDFEFREEVGDPFIIRMHHIDYYPKGNDNMGVKEENLKGKRRFAKYSEDNIVYPPK